MNKYIFLVSNFQNEDFTFSAQPELIEASGETEVDAAVQVIEQHYGVTVSNDCESIEAINLALEPSLIFMEKSVL